MITSNFMPQKNPLHIFGIRHHGPGSARSLRRVLQELQPDIILVEGPPDAQEVLPLLAHEQMQPPVALLIYAPEAPQHAVYYPFAIYSPEWQAIHYGLSHDIPVRFMDLPQMHQMQLPKKPIKPEEAEVEPPAGADLAVAVPAPVTPATYTPAHEVSADDAAPEEGPQQEEEENRPGAPRFNPRHDPLRWIAEAAGYNDSERWWEDMVEHRRDDTDVFAAILEAMTALRREVEHIEAETAGDMSAASAASNSARPESVTPSDTTPDTTASETSRALFEDPVELQREARREAWMREAIREAQSQGFERISVVCGAWHAPALSEMPPAKDDAALLKGLPKTKVQATWVPWTYGRLCFASGYGAGMESPGWYHHLWTTSDRAVAVRWMARVASLLREQDMDASSAHVIEAVRLAESLAALRERPLPGLPELDEATQAILCFGSDLPLRLIHEKLVVGEVLGVVPEETPTVPLQQNLTREQKRLRLPPEASQKVLDLDLRKAGDLERSHLLHRMNLLSVPWGHVERAGGGRGTFHEVWRIQWQPEFAVRLIEAGAWGNTVFDASTACARDAASRAADLPALTGLLDQVLMAALPEAAEHVMTRLQAAAAVAGDVGHLMAALPPLGNVLRYGDVRQTKTESVQGVVDGLVARICIGLPLACASLNDEAAEAMVEQITQVNTTLSTLQNDEHLGLWQGTLRQLADMSNAHGLVAGRCCRILLDSTHFEVAEVARRLSLALSRASEPAQAAAWVAGFLQGSGMYLLHDERLWSVLDEWVMSHSKETFQDLLPLLRRTFATFTAPERRQMGERVKQAPGLRRRGLGMAGDNNFDRARAEQVLPLVMQLLGLKTKA